MILTSLNFSLESKRFTKISCKTSGKTFSISVCYIKAYSRNTTFVNIVGDTKKEINKIYVRKKTCGRNNSLTKFIQLDYSLSYQYLSTASWRTIIKLPQQEVCGWMNAASKFSGVEYLIMLFLNSTKDTFPKCPIPSGYQIRVVNYTENDDFKSIQLFPSGDYRTRITLSDDFDPFMVDVDVRFTIKSGGKYEF